MFRGPLLVGIATVSQHSIARLLLSSFVLCLRFLVESLLKPRRFVDAFAWYPRTTQDVRFGRAVEPEVIYAKRTVAIVSCVDYEAVERRSEFNSGK